MAWTDITRPLYERNNGRYASDCTDEEWAIIEPQRWSWFFDQFTAYLRWIMVSNQAAILVGSVLLS